MATNNPPPFTPTDDHVILVSRGTYKQAKVARRGVNVYAAVGGGYVMLYKGGTTSSDKLRWEYLENESHYKRGHLGRLEVAA